MANRSHLLQAVKEYTRVKSFYFVSADELRPKQITNAITRWASGAKAQDVVAFMDTTLFSSGKEGFLATDKQLYIRMMYNNTIELDTFHHATVKDSDLIVHFKNGTVKTVYCSIYAEDVANFLNTYIQIALEEQQRIDQKPQVVVGVPAAEPPFGPEDVIPVEYLSVTSVEELNEAMADDQIRSNDNDSAADGGDWDEDDISSDPDVAFGKFGFLDEEPVAPQSSPNSQKFRFCPYCGGVNLQGVQLCASCGAFLPNDPS